MIFCSKLIFFMIKYYDNIIDLFTFINESFFYLLYVIKI